MQGYLYFIFFPSFNLPWRSSSLPRFPTLFDFRLDRRLYINEFNVYVSSDIDKLPIQHITVHYIIIINFQSLSWLKRAKAHVCVWVSSGEHRAEFEKLFWSLFEIIATWKGSVKSAIQILFFGILQKCIQEKTFELIFVIFKTEDIQLKYCCQKNL